MALYADNRVWSQHVVQKGGMCHLVSPFKSSLAALWYTIP